MALGYLSRQDAIDAAELHHQVGMVRDLAQRALWQISLFGCVVDLCLPTNETSKHLGLEVVHESKKRLALCHHTMQ